MEVSWGGLRIDSLRRNFSTQILKLPIYTRLFKILTLLDHDHRDRCGWFDVGKELRNGHLDSQIENTSSTGNAEAWSATKTRKEFGPSASTAAPGSQIIRPPLLMSMWKRRWNLVSGIGGPMGLQKTCPRLRCQNNVTASSVDQSKQGCNGKKKGGGGSVKKEESQPV